MSDERKLFGTDGIRGVANRHPMTAEVALKVGRAVASHFRGRSNRVDKQSIILIGKDTRRSSYMIEQALAAGVMSQGAFALLVGPMPTPGVAFLTQSMRADAGIMVSASHNSYEYNGIKLFGHDGFKLPNDVEAHIESLMETASMESSLPVADGIGRAKRIDDAMGRYVVHAKLTFPQKYSLRNIRIVLDTANGAAYRFAPIVFEELGAEVIQLGNNPNGTNINNEVGALYPRPLQDAILKYRADIGIALDGDADRAVLIDEKGEVLDGDQVIALLAKSLNDRKELRGDSIVVTQMSNMGLDTALKKEGIGVHRSQVGDRFVMETMREKNLNFGGEQSGHIVMADYSTTGDGTIAGLAALTAMKDADKPLSELKKIMTPMPQLQRNVRVQDKKNLQELPNVQKAIGSAESSLKGRGRVLVRYSGTEPLCRIMLEAEDSVMLRKMADSIEEAIKRDLSC